MENIAYPTKGNNLQGLSIIIKDIKDKINRKIIIEWNIIDFLDAFLGVYDYLPSPSDIDVCMDRVEKYSPNIDWNLIVDIVGDYLSENRGL